jgi:hypothetical protein
MDWLTFIVELTDAVAWPTVALIALILWRRELTMLLGLVNKLKAGPLEAEFNRKIEQVRDEAPLALTSPRTDDPQRLSF